MCGSACSSEGLEQRPRRESVWEGSGPGSASLACPRTLARCVELWGSEQMCGFGCFGKEKEWEKNFWDLLEGSGRVWRILDPSTLLQQVPGRGPGGQRGGRV